MDITTQISIEDAEKEKSIIRLTEDVRIKLLDQYNVDIPPVCSGFIVRCLRIKDYDVNKAAQLVHNFARTSKVLDDMLEKFQPKFYRDVYFGGTFTVLKYRDSQGRKVLISRVEKWDTKVFSFDEAASAAMLLFSYVVGQSAETQRKGVVFIHDLSGFGMHHVTAIKPGRIRQLVSVMQDGSPGRIKGVHMIFHPRIFGLIYKLVKPFLKEKLSKRIHFHGDDLNSLHKHVSVEHLPASLGGLLDDQTESIDVPLLEELMKQDTIHKYLQTYRVPSQ